MYYLDAKIGEAPLLIWALEPPKPMGVDIERIRECVVFLGRPQSTPGGTGFLVHHPSHFRSGWNQGYVVTAGHVLERAKGSEIHVHINVKEVEGSLCIPTEQKKWVSPPNSLADVRVYPIELDERLEARAYPLRHNCPSPKNGDKVLTVGMLGELYANGFDKDRLRTIVRTGFVAYKDDAPVKVRGVGQDAYLIDSTSTGGLSGAPAFLCPANRTTAGGVTSIHESAYLLGINIAHFGIERENVSENINFDLSVVIRKRQILAAIKSDKMRALEKDLYKYDDPPCVIEDTSEKRSLSLGSDDPGSTDSSHMVFNPPDGDKSDS